MAFSIPTQFSFSKTLSSQNPLLLSKFSHLSIYTPHVPRKTTTIRMGGGPRTYPGGVSKWQWKRMQTKKAKQLLKARLCRERQIYEMRKRAELKAAVSELERPWEVVERAPNLFSVKADEQLKVLADRFQKPGGFDLWSENDGPQVFKSPDGLPSARFFPKGVVHSVKPYGLIRRDNDGEVGLDDESECEREDGFLGNMVNNGKFRNNDDDDDDDDDGLLGLGDGSDSDGGYWDNSDGKWSIDKNARRSNDGRMQKGSRRSSRIRSGLGSLDSEEVGLGNDGWISKSGGLKISRYSKAGDAALIQRTESKTNRSRNDGSISGNGGLRNVSYDEFGDGALKQRGKINNNRSRNDGRVSQRVDLRNSRYSGSGDGTLMHRGEHTTSRSQRQRGSLRNSKYFKSGDGALTQQIETKLNGRKNDGRISRSGGLKNSRYSKSRNSAMMGRGEADTRMSRSNGRISGSNRLRNSKYSSESEVFDMSLQQDGSYEFHAKTGLFDSHSGTSKTYGSF